MSEQFAMQPDEFDSTNNRLDSILDRLNALGESAASMKDAPLRPLQSVPPLEPGVAEVVETAAPTPPPNLGLVPPVAPAPVVEAPVVTAPAVATPAVEVSAPEATTIAEPAVQPELVAPVPAPVAPDAMTPAETVPTAIVPGETAVPVPGETAVPTSDMADPAPVAVEHYGLDLTPAPVEHTPDFEHAPDFDHAPDLSQAESMEAADVFELDTASLEAEAAIDTPEAPTSIFSLTSTEPVAAPEEGDGWVSHHGDDHTTPVDVVSVDENVDPLWAIEPAEATPTEEAPSAVVEEPVDMSFFETSTAEATTPVEEPVEDFFAALENSEEPVNIAGIDMAPPADETAADLDTDGFTSDDDLPIPDFTGVYNESPTDNGFWADSDESVPKSVDPSMGQISARRDELDKLRPVEGEESIALEKEPVDRSVMLQIVGVIFVGILAVLAVFLLDPAAVADMRESLEGLLP